MPYADVIELALYHEEHGFYSSGGQAGRRGDFITSPEVGPLFGNLVANALDAEWDRLGQPEVFTVVDYGAGPGTLARSIAAADPRCRARLQYVAVERSTEQRAQHPEWVLSDSSLAEATVGDGLTGVVIANELLDNMAFTPVLRSNDQLEQLVVVAEGNHLTTAPGPALTPTQSSWFAEDLEQGLLQDDAATWLTTSLESLTAGRILVIDYARLHSSEVTLRTYANHEQAGDPLVGLGTKDITVDLDLAQIQNRTRVADSIRTQADWLSHLGIADLVAEGQRIWEESAAVGDLAALKAKSRVREAESLMDTVGLGGFLVAEWVVE